MKRIDGITPNGGIYKLIFYCNDKMEEVSEELATRCIITEYDSNDNLIMETFAKVGVNKEKIEKNKEPIVENKNLFEDTKEIPIIKPY